jgi:glutamine synthetase
VNKHQGLLRATVANAGQDHRLGANEAPPAIISIFLGAELLKVFEAIEKGEAGESSPGSFLGLGTQVLPPLPMHGGDRNRTSPFAFTGNKFEFRALGSSMSLSMPNTVLNTIVAEAIDELSDKLEANTNGDLEAAVRETVKDSFAANKQIVFEGDNYDEAWHKEAEERGLLNLRTTPDALPQYLEESSLKAFDVYGVLSEREVESRYEVAIEQYAITINIEAETAASIAKTMILPAALRHRALVAAGGPGAESLLSDIDAAVEALIFELAKLDDANDYPEGVEGLDLAKYARDQQIPAMLGVREAADRLEKIVADDLWPLPKYSEILFVK